MNISDSLAVRWAQSKEEVEMVHLLMIYFHGPCMTQIKHERVYMILTGNCRVAY
jgi:hypothetical protein